MLLLFDALLLFSKQHEILNFSRCKSIIIGIEFNDKCRIYNILLIISKINTQIEFVVSY